MDTPLLDPFDAAALLAIRQCLDAGLLTRADMADAYASGGMARLAALAEQHRLQAVAG